MPEISESELTILENTLVKMREALVEDESPESMTLKNEIIESEQIISSKLDTNQIGDTGPTGGASMYPDEEMMPKKDEEYGAGEISMEEIQSLNGHLMEAMAIMQKILPQAPAPEMP